MTDTDEIEQRLRDSLWDALDGNDLTPARWVRVTKALHRHYAELRALLKDT